MTTMIQENLFHKDTPSISPKTKTNTIQKKNPRSLIIITTSLKPWQHQKPQRSVVIIAQKAIKLLFT